MNRVLKKVKSKENWNGAKIIIIYKGKSAYRGSIQKPSWRVSFLENGEIKDYSLNTFQRMYVYSKIDY